MQNQKRPAVAVSDTQQNQQCILSLNNQNVHQNDEDSYTFSNGGNGVIELKKNEIKMSGEEVKLYGKGSSRFPKGYKKIKLIGKGGCAVVFMAQKKDAL